MGMRWLVTVVSPWRVEEEVEAEKEEEGEEVEKVVVVEKEELGHHVFTTQLNQL